MLHYMGMSNTSDRGMQRARQRGLFSSCPMGVTVDLALMKFCEKTRGNAGSTVDSYRGRSPSRRGWCWIR